MPLQCSQESLAESRNSANSFEEYQRLLTFTTTTGAVTSRTLSILSAGGTKRTFFWVGSSMAMAVCCGLLDGWHISVDWLIDGNA